MAEIREMLTIPNKPKWNCQITTSPQKPEGFTVGEVFTLGCEGEPLALKEPLKVVLSEQAHHVLVLLKPLEITDRKISYQATSYRAGSYQMPFLDITDAQGGGFISQPMQFKTISVMDPKQPQKDPYGPIAPLKMEWPAWMLFSLLVVAAVMVAWSLVYLRRRLQRQSLEKNIKKFQSPMGSYHQYSKDIRLLKRGVLFSAHHEWSEEQKKNYLDQLDQTYRMFILREFILPADRWPMKAIMKGMQGKDKAGYPKYSPAVIKAFREIERARGSLEKITSRDCEQITGLCSLAVDGMWKNKKAVST